MSYQDFKNRVLGKGFDIDRAFGNQCWDGYAYYCQYLGVPYANCTVTGYVRDIWEQRARNGMLNNFDEVVYMQAGDIAVFKVCNATPYSHVAIFDHDAGGGYGWFLGQNQGATNGVFNLVKLPYSATYDTAFRKKGTSQPKAQSPKTQQTKTGRINYQAHVQNDGWQNPVCDGATAGTTGKSLRMEGLKIWTTDGTVVQEVNAHIQNIGWKKYSHPGKDTVIGTTGQSLRLEALIIKTSKPCKMRGHIQDKSDNGGWTNWVDCDGKQMVGTEGQSRRLEAVEIKRV